jgi:hypothetical protein
MHKRLTTAIVATLLIVALAVPLATLAGPEGGGGQGTPGAKKGGERHPEIREAMRQLQHARVTLQRDAARDFEGHRAKAVKHVDEALAELRLALQSDKN